MSVELEGRKSVVHGKREKEESVVTGSGIKVSVVLNLERKRNKSGRVYYYAKTQIPFDELKALGLEELVKQLLIKRSINADLEVKYENGKPVLILRPHLAVTA